MGVLSGTLKVCEIPRVTRGGKEGQQEKIEGSGGAQSRDKGCCWGSFCFSKWTRTEQSDPTESGESTGAWLLRCWEAMRET